LSDDDKERDELLQELSPMGPTRGSFTQEVQSGDGENDAQNARGGSGFVKKEDADDGGSSFYRLVKLPGQ
jgi:hypothetical protein